MMESFSEVDRKKICEWAADELWSGSPDCNKALDYLRDRRGLDDATISRFSLGYVPREAEHDLAGRLIMPFFDHHNKLTCLTTRDFRPDAKLPHWHEAFPKQSYLYGLDLAKMDIFESNKALIVEGQFDVQALHSRGIRIAIAPLGGALSYSQLSLLRRYCTDYYIWFDPDTAGERALDRVLDMYKEYALEGFGINIVPVCTEGSLDPDEFIISNGKKSVIDLMKASKEAAKGKEYAPGI